MMRSATSRDASSAPGSAGPVGRFLSHHAVRCSVATAYDGKNELLPATYSKDARQNVRASGNASASRDAKPATLVLVSANDALPAVTFARSVAQPRTRWRCTDVLMAHAPALRHWDQHHRRPERGRLAGSS